LSERKVKYGALMIASCISALFRFGHFFVFHFLHRLKMNSVFMPCILAGWMDISRLKSFGWNTDGELGIHMDNTITLTRKFPPGIARLPSRSLRNPSGLGIKNSGS